MVGCLEYRKDNPMDDQKISLTPGSVAGAMLQQSEKTPSKTSSSAELADRLLSLSEETKQSRPLTPEGRTLVLMFWKESIENMGEKKFYDAWKQCMLSTRFIPDISEIRAVYPPQIVYTVPE
jgi:hypothetical protein